MTNKTIGLLLGALALSACHVGVTYSHVGWGYWGYHGYGHGTGAFSTSYGQTGIVWNAPSPPPGGAAPPAVLLNDTPVEGSDGSFGWKRVAGQTADYEIHRLSEALVRGGCTVGTYQYDETKATCANVNVLLRRDAGNVYLLCAPGVQKGDCQATWTRVLGAPP